MLHDIFCILWNVVLLLLLVAATGALSYVAFALSSFAWPAALFVLAAVVVWKLVK